LHAATENGLNLAARWRPRLRWLLTTKAAILNNTTALVSDWPIATGVIEGDCGTRSMTVWASVDPSRNPGL
jgi:phosphodiesterase/alkaline phosphatase D-like protein